MGLLGQIVEDWKSFWVKKIGTLFTGQTADPSNLDSTTAAMFYRKDLHKFRVQTDLGVFKNLATEDQLPDAGTIDATAADVAPLGPAPQAGAVGKLIDAGHVHQADKSAFRFAVFSGVDASGGASHVAIAALKVGDQVMMLVNLTDDADGTASFEATVTVNGQLQQPAGNLTTKKYVAIFIAKS